MAIFDVCQRLDVVSRWRGITLSHLRLVLRLNSSAQQQLLSTANAHRSLESLERAQTLLLKGSEPARAG